MKQFAKMLDNVCKGDIVLVELGESTTVRLPKLEDVQVPNEEIKEDEPHDYETNSCGGAECKNCGHFKSIPDISTCKPQKEEPGGGEGWLPVSPEYGRIGWSRYRDCDFEEFKKPQRPKLSPSEWIVDRREEMYGKDQPDALAYSIMDFLDKYFTK